MSPNLTTMKKLWLSTSRNLATFLLALLLLSCAGLASEELSQKPAPPGCWLLQPVVYRLRHSARLEYHGKQEMLEGFMELDLKRERAHLVIFNSLGLTLLNLEIEPDYYKLVQSNAESKKVATPNRREQQFSKTVAAAVQHIFLSLKSDKEEFKRGDQRLLLEFSETPPNLIKISERQYQPSWIATYHDYQKFAAGELPERITLENYKPKFTLTLWLHKAEILTEPSR